MSSWIRPVGLFMPSRTFSPVYRKRTTYETIHVTAANFAVACIIVSMGIFSYTMIVPYVIIEKFEFAAEGQTYVGGMLRMSMDYCKLTDDTPSKAIVTLNNDITIVVPNGGVRAIKGCHSTHFVQPVDPHVPPGRYTMGVTVEYTPWPWRKITQSFTSQPFTILPARTE